ncbi:hypothetical protein GGR57DRAFT_467025 [Xylariaceae sp. FL1272]|nr:hypothetical protein GGR57DRAFT_467025 [Xylariaceae sp. FL1272]
MSDPLLTSLCSICHIQAPKYKCPRCAARTCSLACVKKHKTWSTCNGERDATAYRPRDQLKTDAGLDHDYNFLTKIEHSVERAHRILRDDRGIMPDESAEQPPPPKRARLGRGGRFNKGQSRGRTTLEEGDGVRKWDRAAVARLKKLGIHVTSLPYGMSRSKENKTSFNRRTGTINWQVEWVLFGDQTSAQSNITRVMAKALDQISLHVALAEALELRRTHQLSEDELAEQKQVNRQQRPSRHVGQNYYSSAWNAAPCLVQSHTETFWSFSRDHDSAKRYRFFYLKPKTPSRETPKLVPLESTAKLADVLPGLDIVEFPTIYVFPTTLGAPGDGFVVERRDWSKKRKMPPTSAPTHVGYESESEEDGEVVEEPSDETSSSGSDSEMSG